MDRCRAPIQYPKVLHIENDYHNNPCEVESCPHTSPAVHAARSSNISFQCSLVATAYFDFRGTVHQSFRTFPLSIQAQRRALPSIAGLAIDQTIPSVCTVQDCANTLRHTSHTFH